MDTKFPNHLESSLESTLLSAFSSTPFMTLEATVPMPRNGRAISIGDTGSCDSYISDLFHTLSSSDEERSQYASCDGSPLGFSQMRHHIRMTNDHSGLNFNSEDLIRAPRDMNGEIVHLLAEIQTSQHVMQDNLDKTREVAKSVEHQAYEVASEIREMKRLVVTAMDDRERELLKMVERIRLSKSNTLRQQDEGIRLALGRLQNVVDILKFAMESGTGMEIMKAQVHAKTEMAHLKRDNLPTQEDSMIAFIPPDSSLLRAVYSCGRVASSGCAGTSILEGSRQSTRGRLKTLTLHARDHLGELRTSGHDQVAAYLAEADGSTSRADIVDRKDGTYAITCCPAVDGQSLLHVTMRGLPVLGSPFPLAVSFHRKYAEIFSPVLTFGEEGGAEGQFCRPWGVCCARNGNIIVADRSNNRIQVFNANGLFSFCFGSRGTGIGEFERPAGVATDGNDNIVVADKDNHRIQVFTANGEFSFMFGERGAGVGQFNYPWDVAVSSKGLIIVSDTRNHRIQLFTHDGKYINKYGFEASTSMWKHFDSPRSVCFTPQDQIVVTDFNNHRIVIIDPNFLSARFLGCEGSGPKQFQRPQGVAVDMQGHIIVADSKNHRVQIFEQNGSFLTQFGSFGKGEGELDRPSGICLAPDGKIVVIDFGNNRIQVF